MGKGIKTMRTFHVGKVEEFGDLSKKVMTVGEDEIGVFRVGEEFFAWRNFCPHQGGPICQGRIFSLVLENIDLNMESHGRVYDDEKVNVVCPWHGLEFDIRTGKHPGNPEMALDPIAVQVDGGSGYLLVEDLG